MFALGLICWLFDRPLDQAAHLLKNKFAKKPSVLEANIKVMTDGYNYGNNIHASVSTYRIETERRAKKGFLYRCKRKQGNCIRIDRCI